MMLGSALSAVAVPVDGWNRTFENIEFDCRHSAHQTQDGGYILSGETIVNHDEDNANAFLMKLNSEGNEEWNRTFGGSAHDCTYSVHEITDGGYILAGYLEASGKIDERDSDAWLIKTDSNGTEKWNKTFGGINHDSARSFKETNDRGYIIAGDTNSFGAGASDAWLIKTDSNGTEEWNKTFGGISEDHAFSVNESRNGGYIIAGYTNSSDPDGADAWLIKTDPNGTEEWNRTFGGTSSDYAYSVKELDDGGYIIGGYTESFGAGKADAWIIKTDSNGTEEWNRTFGGPNIDYSYFVQKTENGGFVLAGGTQPTSDYKDTQTLLIKTDSNGTEEWNMIFGGEDTDFRTFVQENRDGEYILIGGTYSYGMVSDAWLIKVGSDKNVKTELEKLETEMINLTNELDNLTNI
ncbi:MAG: hypothetical protein ACP5N0_13000 [Methanosarcina sp.]|uniref:hypothetical protein n=1 Tax=Methanosarcina sp. TaxID=2213 RepID=UPI003BB75EC2